MEMRCPLVGKQEQPQQPPPTAAAEDRRTAFVKYDQQYKGRAKRVQLLYGNPIRL